MVYRVTEQVVQTSHFPRRTRLAIRSRLCSSAALTNFVVTAARDAACRAIEEAGIIRLSVEDQRQIAEAILNPPEPAPALRRAFERRRELLGSA